MDQQPQQQQQENQQQTFGLKQGSSTSPAVAAQFPTESAIHVYQDDYVVMNADFEGVPPAATKGL